MVLPPTQLKELLQQADSAESMYVLLCRNKMLSCRFGSRKKFIQAVEDSLSRMRDPVPMPGPSTTDRLVSEIYPLLNQRGQGASRRILGSDSDAEESSLFKRFAALFKRVR